MFELTQRLQAWYARHCDASWEHQYGIKIDTLDNPGWSVKINLTGTRLHHKSFTTLNTERTERDWLSCRVQNETFEGVGGPENLAEIVEVFLRWDEEVQAT